MGDLLRSSGERSFKKPVHSEMEACRIAVIKKMMGNEIESILPTLLLQFELLLGQTG